MHISQRYKSKGTFFAPSEPVDFALVIMNSFLREQLKETHKVSIITQMNVNHRTKKQIAQLNV